MKWEYRIEFVLFDDPLASPGEHPADSALVTLNDLGNDGWEAVTVIRGLGKGGDAYAILLKRLRSKQGTTTLI